MILIELIKQTIELEIGRSGPQLKLLARQGETARQLVISLTDKGSAYVPAANCRAVFTALKPDGKLIFNACQIQGRQILYTLTAQTTALSGLLHCQLRLYGENDALLLSPRFFMELAPAVYKDGDIVDSSNEVSALTALVSESSELIDEIRQSLASGAFVPQFTVGSVETLPAGQLARVELSGSGENPVLSFAIPQGEVGSSEELIPDSELSLSSIRPVQNRVITEALSNFVEKDEHSLSIANFVEKETFFDTLSNFVELEEFDNSMAQKQDKIEGKGLSSNDFTDELKAKLDGIEAGANKYSLSDSAVTSSKIADYAVTARKLSADAKSRGLTAALTAANWQNNAQTVSVEGVTADNNVIVAAHPDCRTLWNDCEVYCTSQAEGALTFACGTVPTEGLSVNVIILV